MTTLTTFYCAGCRKLFEKAKLLNRDDVLYCAKCAKKLRDA